jgi:hypothetical protein
VASCSPGPSKIFSSPKGWGSASLPGIRPRNAAAGSGVRLPREAVQLQGSRSWPGEAEHYEFAVIAAQGVRERRPR